MKRMISALFFVSFPFVFVTHAYAYIDPGTGSMIIQGVLAAIAVCTVSIGISWRRLKGFFGRLFGRKKDD